MRSRNIELKQLYRSNRNGSYASQRALERVIDLMVGQLQELGDRHPGYHRPIRTQQRRGGRMHQAVDNRGFWQC